MRFHYIDIVNVARLYSSSETKRKKLNFNFIKKSPLMGIVRCEAEV